MCGTAVKFDNPPVVETVLSVQFSPLASLGAGHLGAFWHQLGRDWPIVSDAPPVEPVFERFPRHAAWEPGTIGLRISEKADIRLQVRNASRDRMIQVQNGRFFYNWLGKEASEYPSYEKVRPEFEEHWEGFREFVLSQFDNSPDAAVKPNQWEVIYVNHIPCGTVWHELSDISGVFTFLQEPPLDGLHLAADGIGGEWRFELVPEKGRLYVKLGMIKKGETLHVVMTLTARGTVGEGTSLVDGLDFGHQAIVDAFARLTSRQAQETWGVHNDD